EGRSALAMSAAQFKYMFYAQALCGVQMCVLLPFLYFPTDMMSLVTDILGVYVLGYAIYRFKAANKITTQRVSIRLSRDIFYLFGELLFIIGVILTIFLVFGYSQHGNSLQVVSKHATATFFIVTSLCIFKAITLSNFSPHREPRFKNRVFLSVITFSILLIFFCFLFLFLGNKFVVNIFQFSVIGRKDAFIIACGIFASCMASAFFTVFT
ncbi:hypothetical protein PAEPH01_2728, partial [Pancytospora epiphaga]